MKSYYETHKPKHECSSCDQKLYQKIDWGKCAKCKEINCTRHIYFYVDESNRAITKSSKPYCRNCYREVYGK